MDRRTVIDEKEKERDLALASASHASTRLGEVPAEVVDGYERRHPATKGMSEYIRGIWDSIDDKDRYMIRADRAYFGTNGGRESEVSVSDVLGLRQVD